MSQVRGVHQKTQFYILLKEQYYLLFRINPNKSKKREPRFPLRLIKLECHQINYEKTDYYSYPLDHVRNRGTIEQTDCNGREIIRRLSLYGVMVRYAGI